MAATPVFAATRSAAAMINEVKVTAPAMAPESRRTDAIGSTLVCTLTDELLGLGKPPSFRPTRVMVTAVLAASVVPPAAITIDVGPGANGERVVPILEIVAVGVTVDEKKLEG